MEFFSLQGKVAVITGGGSGIGLATAKRFVKAGATVVIANRRDSSALASSFGAEYVHADVCKEADVEKLMDGVASQHGRIDIVVNNAGYGQVGMTCADVTEAAMQAHLQPNVLGVMFGTKHGVKHMPRGGAIVNVSSLGGIIGIPGYGAYVATKFAVVGMTKTAALELAPQGIRVNSVCPGTIDTPINHQGGADAELELVKIIAPLGRIGEPEEVAALIHCLAAPDCGYVTGEAVVIDGGWAAGPSIALFEKLAATK